MLSQSFRTMKSNSGILSAKSFVFILLTLLVFGSTFTILSQVLEQRGRGLNEQLTTEAWQALNTRKFSNAIRKASECIDEFEPSAIQEQNGFLRDSIPCPPTGHVDDSTKRRIFEHGVLNDVGTCWFIKGRALERLDSIVQARNAYRRSMRYPCARTYDKPQDLFWSPAKVSGERLQYLNENSD